MGKVSILNSEQKIVLSALAKQKIVISDYYFTGGTALSEIYLHHRDSVDLDFFSLKPVDQPKITEMLKSCFDALGVTLEMQFVDPVLMCYLSFPHGKKLKVDFAQYPYPQLELSKKHIGNLKVDSLIDIAINKMQTITQRQEVKDFVDLYFLLQKFTFWDLRQGVAEKFRMDIEPLLVSSDFLAVEDFTFLPRMRIPLTLYELKVFFRSQALNLAKTMVE